MFGADDFRTAIERRSQQHRHADALTPLISAASTRFMPTHAHQEIQTALALVQMAESFVFGPNTVPLRLEDQCGCLRGAFWNAIE